MFLTILLIIIGVAILIYGADLLVKGAASIAKKLGISSIVIGLTVVAFGTSAPELVVNLFSVTKGTTDLAIANIIGSNIANILLILGITAIIFPLAVKKNTTYKEIPFALLAVAIVAIFGNDLLINGSGNNFLDRTEGITLVLFFIIFLYYTFGLSKIKGEHEEIKEYALGKSFLFFTVGLVALILGGKIIVDNAVILARIAGMSERLIGLTIVAIGTSLPELATSIVAALRKQTDIAIGNVVGSNIFNIFWILGLIAIIKPIPFDININIDVLVSVIATLLLFFFMFIDDKHRLNRWQGFFFVLLYLGYLSFIIIKQ
ncbi:MAG: sodium:proton exchanger [Candidatus Magasanikbacteria bacterium CG_4_10_14_0_8_um_filter_32_14]|uniref:Sodium:proton exchanger n=2 Tax=Candidatus Magasanikiibacteriota TaxID=1752731 RepID=A0A2M7R9J7_9BACT|nr:MAG: sodium:proton exchanger [Candidatus Magasanikbacteria bacterium CG1_02_32_51]PIY93324.1 MAG: sodium:proton exchanger [Candidatus Magasanikbacteria bacterium CG_4_10_14_0_8_um_filter_32_14]